MSAWVEVICSECSLHGAGAHAGRSVPAKVLTSIRATLKRRGWLVGVASPYGTEDFCCRACRDSYMARHALPASMAPGSIIRGL